LAVTETGNSGISTTIGTKTINVYNMPPKGFLDSPKNNSFVSGIYRINGWFLDNAGVEKIEVVVDDEVIGKAVYGTLRSDVLNVYPQYKNENCGYYFDLDTSKIIEGKHKIKICETSKNVTQTLLPVIEVIVSKLPVRGYIDRPALKEPVSG